LCRFALPQNITTHKVPQEVVLACHLREDLQEQDFGGGVEA
jgi:hypothetical protein